MQGRNTVSKLVWVFFVVVVVSLAMVGQAHAAVSCHKINAKGVGQETSPGTTVAQIKGGGLLQGTTLGLFVPTATGFEGPVEFTTNKATLTVFVTGSFAGVEFTASGPVVAATGKLEGAAGNLEFIGVVDPSDGSFVETVTGEICVDLAPES